MPRSFAKSTIVRPLVSTTKMVGTTLPSPVVRQVQERFEDGSPPTARSAQRPLGRVDVAVALKMGQEIHDGR